MLTLAQVCMSKTPLVVANIHPLIKQLHRKNTHTCMWMSD